MHERVCIFCKECEMHFDSVVEHHACAGVYVRQVSYTFAYTLQDVHMRSCMCILVVWRWGNEDGWVQLVYKSTCCLAWGVILTEGKIGVLSVSSLFSTRVGVYVGVWVCVRTHTHTLHRWGTRM